MNNKNSILTPVLREDFNLNFGGNTGIEGIEPGELFSATIAQFKKLAAGPYFWFIADVVKGITHSAGGMLNKIVPVTEAEFVHHSPDVLFRNTHPDDIVQMFAFTNYWVSFFMQLAPDRKAHVRCTIYVRLINPQQLYKWTMVQFADAITDNEGKVLYGLTLVTDISHIKKEGVAMMSILDTFDESCQLFYCTDGNAIALTGAPLPKISPREIEVLRLLAIGYSSKQIAEELKIAIKTIDNHRQNMLHKTNCKSAGELVAYGINKGFI